MSGNLPVAYITASNSPTNPFRKTITR